MSVTNSALLRQRIEDSGLKYVFIAGQMGISKNTLTAKIENRTAFKAEEIKKFCELLRITSLTEREQIFFAQNSN